MAGIAAIVTGFWIIAKAQSVKSEAGQMRSLDDTDVTSVEFFAKHARIIDAEGNDWNREETSKNCGELFAHSTGGALGSSTSYAKKNSAAVIETALIDAESFFVANLVWKNAMLASERRVWVHRMSVVMIRENDEWRILLMQITAGFGEQNSSPLSVRRNAPG